MMKRLVCFLRTIAFIAIAVGVGADDNSNQTTAAENNEGLNVTRLDCDIRQLAWNRSKAIILETNPDSSRLAELLGEVHDALQLNRLCHIEYVQEASVYEEKDDSALQALMATRRRGACRACSHIKRYLLRDDDLFDDFVSAEQRTTLQGLGCFHDSIKCIFVTPLESEVRGQLHDGSFDSPWTCIHQALRHARVSLETENTLSPTPSIHRKIILRQGVHSLKGRTLNLNAIESHLTITGFPGEEAWISGGLKLASAVWKPQPDGIFAANLTDILHGYTLPKTPSLCTSTRRYVRARYPNSDPEIDDWGQTSLQGGDVLEWHLPTAGASPNFTFFDFKTNPPQGVPFKNDSAMEGYNWYASGKGGVCSDVWGPDADSYWCSNASQGGWAEVDQECAVMGQMQIPAGMTFNTSADALQPLLNMTSSLGGGYVFAQHSQSWSMHMFEIAEHFPNDATLIFAAGGGMQGGRNWCRCDQCTYAGTWCGQHKSPPQNDDKRLIGGNWMVENVKGLLDKPGEYFFNRKNRLLYVKPNSTDDLQDLTLGVLTQLVGLRNATNVTIKNLGFRDQAATFMEDRWSAPSGGDWALRRGGAVLIENASHVTISGCQFFRLDGSAVFLSRRTRNVTIEQCKFEWLGENAIATWGETDAFNATAEDFPMHTLIQFNFMRELGIFQIQSSAFASNKAALSTVRNNVMYNMPRAAINFNDLVGGGDVVEGNVIFNTCRKSGDHGPINTWDRQAYLTKIKDPENPGFVPLPREIRHNLIFANYGASQGVDNDDGSSWYRIHHNVFYMADGFKMVSSLE
jgi:hypothetical protein